MGAESSRPHHFDRPNARPRSSRHLRAFHSRPGARALRTQPLRLGHADNSRGNPSAGKHSHSRSSPSCRPVRHRTTATGVEMEVDGRWVAVPSHTLEYRALEGDTGESYGAHWCGWIAPFSRNYITRCAFLPPRLGALH